MAEPPKENWLHTDEVEEFIGALEFVAGILPSTQSNPAQWKWVILALHNAVQGVCVCALRGADPSGISVLDKESGKAVWNWLDVESRKAVHPPQPPEKLAKMLELYRRVKKANYLENPLRPDSKKDNDIRKLNSLRNEFIHFVPKGWSLELSGMPRILGNAHSCIEHLAVRFPTFAHHYKSGDGKRVEGALSILRAYSDKN